MARHALFFNDTGAKELYKEYVRSILERRNSRNGLLYREDPTIFAWDLINEPRCETWKVRVATLQHFMQPRLLWHPRSTPTHNLCCEPVPA